MREFFLKKVLALPAFRGKGRLVGAARDFLYRPYRVTLEDGVQMELDPFEWTQLLYASGSYSEPVTVRLIRRLLSPGDVFVDVGAHVGALGLVARQCIASGGKVISVEPQPYNCQQLLRNWELNGFTNLVLLVAAAGPRCGTVTLPQQSVTDRSRLSLALPMPDRTDLEFTVPMVSLDSVFTDHGVEDVELLKIDVEGFELDVLEGMEGSFERVRNVILEVLDDPAAETSPSSQSHRSVAALAEWLTSRAYQLRTVEGEPWTGKLPIPESNLWASRQEMVGL